jgi:hypothetical protein
MFLWGQVIENTSITEVHQVKCFIAWKQKESQLLKYHASFKIWTMGKYQKGRFCQLISIMFFSLLWISWLLNMGPTGCPKRSVRNYHSMLHNISEKQRSHMTIWGWRTWFHSIWSGSVLHTWISHNLTYLSTKFSEKPMSCIQVSTVLYDTLQPRPKHE